MLSTSFALLSHTCPPLAKALPGNLQTEYRPVSTKQSTDQIFWARDNISRINRFRAALNSCELKEIHLQNRKFTFFDKGQILLSHNDVASREYKHYEHTPASARLGCTQPANAHTQRQKKSKPLKVMSNRTHAYTNNHQHQPTPMTALGLWEKCFKKRHLQEGNAMQEPPSPDRSKFGWLPSRVCLGTTTGRLSKILIEGKYIVRHCIIYSLCGT